MNSELESDSTEIKKVQLQPAEMLPEDRDDSTPIPIRPEPVHDQAPQIEVAVETVPMKGAGRLGIFNGEFEEPAAKTAGPSGNSSTVSAIQRWYRRWNRVVCAVPTLIL